MQTTNLHNKNARHQILERIRNALGREPTEPGAADIEAQFRHLVEGRRDAHEALNDVADPVALFVSQASAAGTRVIQLDPATSVTDWLANSSVPQNKISLSEQPDITALDWSALKAAPYYRGHEGTGVVKASMAAAETGSLLIHSREVPSGLLFLVEFLVVVLDRKDIIPRYEDVWTATGPLRLSKYGAPRALHLITGPSRTADVEQTIQVGAHGPRELYIVIRG